MNNPNSVQRSKAFIKKGILREFSLSQFTYQTIEQYIAIEKEVQRNKQRYNQSYEGYFINSDGTLDYQSMIKEIDKAIGSGALSINKYLDKSRNRARDINIEHPEIQVYDAVKAQANLGSDINIDLESDDDELSGIPVTFNGDLSQIEW